MGQCQRRSKTDSDALGSRADSRVAVSGQVGRGECECDVLGLLLAELRPSRSAYSEPHERAEDVGEDQERHPHGLGERADFPFIRLGQVEPAIAPKADRRGGFEDVADGKGVAEGHAIPALLPCAVGPSASGQVDTLHRLALNAPVRGLGVSRFPGNPPSCRSYPFVSVQRAGSADVDRHASVFANLNTTEPAFKPTSCASRSHTLRGRRGRLTHCSARVLNAKHAAA
jgi:hypothetical protein